MTKIYKWEIIVEDGPTAADCYPIVVEAPTALVAYDHAEEWAKNNNMRKPMFSRPKKVPEINEVPIIEDDYTDIVEWTPEEEEEFLRIADKNRDL